MIRLSELLSYLPAPPIDAGNTALDPDITGVAYDGRQVTRGSVFVAVWHPGYSADGHDFVAQAIENGAAAVVTGRRVDVPAGVRCVVVENTATALGWLAAGFYGMPSTRLGIVGVTGTDGKTTTCVLTAAVLEAAEQPAAMATTVASKTTGVAQANTQHTSTPEAVELQRLLARTLEEGGTRAVLEATSHALHQDRLAGCEIDVAVVTRVTHEHLEYHGTHENYLAAKAKLLALLRPDDRHPKTVQVPKAAVLNADDSSFAYMAPRAPAPVVAYGLDEGADVRAIMIRERAWGTAYRVVSPWDEGEIELQLPGTFNVYNSLAALAAGCTLGAPFEAAQRALAAQRGVPGRMERVEAGQPFTVVVDFAHTPDSLERVLRLLRSQTRGQVIAVFGSAGERDRAKRAWMGRIAAELADYAVLTDEDPRLEPSEQIIDEIAGGALAAGAIEGRQFERLPDRRRAIKAAFCRAAPGDVVLLAGKGHEQSIIGQHGGKLYTFPWNEHTVAREVLAELGLTGAAA